MEWHGCAVCGRPTKRIMCSLCWNDGKDYGSARIRPRVEVSVNTIGGAGRAYRVDQRRRTRRILYYGRAHATTMT